MSDIVGLCLVGAICAAFVAYGIYRFMSLSREQQLSKVTEWLLWAVTLAEKEYGSGMGKIKLREVYSQFVQTWPDVAKWLSFNEFSELVDAVLVRMRSLLTSNVSAYNYVKGAS